MGTQRLSELDVAPAMTAAPRPGGRLIVLVPSQAIDDAALESTLARLSSSEEQAVVFVAVCENQEEEAQLRRRLSRLTGEGGNRPRTYRLLRGMSWPGAMDAVRQDGDVIVFPYRDLPWVQPPAGAASSSTPSVWTRFPQAARPALKASLVGLGELLLDWAAPLLIVIGFFYLQVRVLDQVSTGTGHGLLMILSVLIEIGLLWRWEQWSSRRLRS